MLVYRVGRWVHLSSPVTALNGLPVEPPRFLTPPRRDDFPFFCKELEAQTKEVKSRGAKPKFQKHGEWVKFCKTRQLGLGGWKRDVGSDPPGKRDLSPDQAYLCKGEGGSSGPRRPLCGAGSSQHAVPAETLPGPSPRPPFCSSFAALFSSYPTKLPSHLPSTCSRTLASWLLHAPSVPPLLFGVMNSDPQLFPPPETQESRSETLLSPIF